MSRSLRFLLDHVDRHPRRLAATGAVLLIASWSLAGYALVRSFNLAHQARVENCRALNELERELFVTFSDFGYAQAYKFLPTTDCETLP